MANSAVSLLNVQPSMPGNKAGLETRITAQLNRLSRIVQTSETDAVGKLCQFVMDYCMYYLELENHLSDSAPRLLHRIHSTQSLLELCAPLNSNGSLLLMRRAWFTLRVAEEMNDVWLQYTGEPLTDHDLTTANIIIHTLLDDDDAELIERLVEKACQQPDQLFRNSSPQEVRSPVSHIFQHWPCLAHNLGIPSAIV